MKYLVRAATASVFGLVLAAGSLFAVPDDPPAQLEAGPVATSTQDFAPLYCYPMDMNDGIIYWTYVTTVSGRNNYRYVVNDGTGMWRGTTSCYANPQFIAGELHPVAKVCILAGTAAVVGAFIPGVGVVGAIFYFTTTCGIEILTY